MSRLNDVFRDLQSDIGVFSKGQFDRVPANAGVYAWFYPLRISSYDLNEFVSEVHRVQAFDASCKGFAEADLNKEFAWRTVSLNLKLLPRGFAIPSNIEGAWQEITEDKIQFEQLRRVLLKSSILMPPLYVGKTSNLNIRCAEHLHGTGKNDFHNRYETFADSVEASASRVSDLLFLCITSDEESQASENARIPIEDIVEEILKFTCNPVYSAK